MRRIWLFIFLLSVGRCCVPQSELNKRPGESPTIISSGRPAVSFLRYKQYHPNVDENSDDASGRRRQPVLRRSKNWKRTMRYYQTSDEVVFQDEEKGRRHGKRTYEDHWMSQRCYAALDRLALMMRMSKPGQDGVRILVLEAWEPTKRRSKTIRPTSLHYEGRALDLTFYVPRGHRKHFKPKHRLDMLAFWAIRAGFDWVHYEDHDHIHVSCKADNPGDALQIPMRCFPENAKVSLENGHSKGMADLRIGDRIQTVDSNGEIVYSPVILFLDRSVDVIDQFLSLKLASDQELRLTADHLIYRLKTQNISKIDADRVEMLQLSNATTIWSQSETIPAKKLQIGDFLLQRDIDSSRLQWSPIISIQKISDRGAYAPLTAQGTVLVDGVVASCYAETHYETVAHVAFAPIRWLSYLMTFQMSEGLHSYSKFLINIADFVQMLSGFQMYG